MNYKKEKEEKIQIFYKNLYLFCCTVSAGFCFLNRKRDFDETLLLVFPHQ